MIFGREVSPDWVRKRGHQLYPEDLTWITRKDPDLLIVGTGSSGRMTVSGESRSFLEDEDIDLWIGNTDEASEYYNVKLEEEGEDRVAGAFHLTC
jgi:hypothetical protein